MPFRQAAMRAGDKKGYGTFAVIVKMAFALGLKPTNGELTMLTCPALHCPLPAWNRTFESADALLEHARLNKTLHPLCPTCLRVFKETAALDQVRDTFFPTLHTQFNQNSYFL